MRQRAAPGPVNGGGSSGHERAAWTRSTGRGGRRRPPPEWHRPAGHPVPGRRRPGCDVACPRRPTGRGRAARAVAAVSALPTGSPPDGPTTVAALPPPPLRAVAPSGARPGPAAGLRAPDRCAPPAADTASDPADPAAARLQLAAAHRLATGAGQVVAVIDTGVSPHPRLGSRLRGVGDYLTGGTGLADCDGHGTAVAGILAASAVGRDDGGVEGMAPAAEVLAIRQSSPSFAVPGPDGTTRTAGDVRTLAEAIVLAVRSGRHRDQHLGGGLPARSAGGLARRAGPGGIAARGRLGCRRRGRRGQRRGRILRDGRAGARRPGFAPRLVRRGRPDGRRGHLRRRSRRVHRARPVGRRGRAGQRPAVPRRGWRNDR